MRFLVILLKGRQKQNLNPDGDPESPDLIIFQGKYFAVYGYSAVFLSYRAMKCTLRTLA